MAEIRSAIPIVAHAVVRGLPGYKLDDAPAIGLQGRSFDPDSEAARATARWSQEAPRTVGEALDVAGAALSDAGVPWIVRRRARRAARAYFFGRLGLAPSHPLPRSGTGE